MLTVKDAFPLVRDRQREGKVVTMKIQLTRNTVVNGQPRAEGEVVEVSDQDGKFLIAIKKAVKFVEPEIDPHPALSLKGEEEQVEIADVKPVLETADRKPRGKRKE